MVKLPGGFSPIQAVAQVGSILNPTGGVSDRNVFTDYSVRGGARSPANGAFIGKDPTAPTSAVKDNQTSTPSPTVQYSGGDVGGYADPYAAWGGQAAFNAARGQIETGQNNYRQGAETSLRDVGNEYDTKTNRFVNEITDSQSGINSGLAGNQLNLRTTMADIVRGIQQGIRSGGVALAGMNASDSGAADAMARAYAQVGNEQTGDARGEAGLKFEELQAQQGQLNRTKNEGITELDRWGDTETDRVRGDFSSKLSSLAADAASKGIAGFGDQSLVSQVLDSALQRLAQIDQSRDSRLAGVKQLTPEEIMAEAIRMENMGQTGNAFSVEGPAINYGSGAPAMGGAPMGQLPIYTKGKDDLAVVPTKEDDKK